MLSPKTIAHRLTLTILLAALTIAAATAQDTNPSAADLGPDPALANLAPVDASAPQPVSAQPAPPDQTYTQQQAAPDAQYPPAALTADGQPADETDDQAADPPPPLFDYGQPPAPAPLYIWCPGYWAHGRGDYFWVPGRWVLAPFYGALWTPPYWDWEGDDYVFHPGYWGTHIGYYGGVDYGFGYIGIGFFGGYWGGNNFFYNRNVTIINEATISTVYNRPVVYKGVQYTTHPANYTSYNGGAHGLKVRPTPGELAAAREQHMPETFAQTRFRQMAVHMRGSSYSENQGHPIRTVIGMGAGTGVATCVGCNIVRPTPAENLQTARQTEAQRAARLTEFQQRRAAAATQNSAFRNVPSTTTTTVSASGTTTKTTTAYTNRPATVTTPAPIVREPPPTFHPAQSEPPRPIEPRPIEPQRPQLHEVAREPIPHEEPPKEIAKPETPHQEPEPHETPHEPEQPRSVPTEPHAPPVLRPIPLHPAPPPRPIPHP